LVATWSELWSLIMKPAAATAVYLATLSIRLFYSGSVNYKVRDEVIALLVRHNLTANELVEAQRALDVLIELLDREKDKGEDIISLLDLLEKNNYESFKSALYSYLKKDTPLDEVRKAIQTLVMWRVNASLTSGKGSYMLITSTHDFIARLEELGFFIPTYQVYHGTIYIIVPAPYVDMDIFKVFEGREKPEVGVRAGVEEVKGRFEGIKPTRDILESIVAEVLSALGFTVQTKLPAKGGDVEVDVWGIKNVKGAQFRVYVSCKNWDKDVDRTVIDQEFGRVLQFYQLPHLRILVVKSLTEPAKKAAFDDGFFTIELGEKASTENTQEIYNIIYNKLKEIFISITPDKIMKVVSRLKEALRELEELI